MPVEKVVFFVSMSEALLPAERKLFVPAIKESIQKDDADTVELILNSLNEMRLKKTEIDELRQANINKKKREPNYE